MKLRFHSILAIATLSGLLAMTAACSDDEQGYAGTDETIGIVSNNLLFTSRGDTATVTLTASSGQVEATLNADWCSATVSGTTVTVIVQPNTSFDGRTALLTLRAGQAVRTLPVQQQGLVVDLPLPVNAHNSPREGDQFTLTLRHALPLEVTPLQSWIHVEENGEQYHFTVDSNAGEHLRRGTVAVECGEYRDTLSIVQYDLADDVLGSYYIFSITSEIPAATHFDVVEQDGQIFMHWPQELYSDTYIPLRLDRQTCSLFIPSGFTMATAGSSTTSAYFYDTSGTLAITSGAGASARLVNNGSGIIMGQLEAANWPGHELAGFIIRSTNALFGSTTLVQIANPLIVRAGPVGTTLTN
ncbi:MAG: hypothetical protein IJ544_02470 [Prevotella sp.]|nr:hypothetical protein [Prevotella sp.]